MKILLLVPYFGEWPIWFPAFLQSCKYNPGVDWLFFTDCKIPSNSYRNVRFVPCSLSDMSSLVSGKLGFEVTLERAFKLCDLRPAYGVIFEQYIADYDFWGHCDIDVIWGDIRHFITHEILKEYDIISARRRIMCGHFGLYRNDEKIKCLFSESADYKDIFRSSRHHEFDERGISEIIRKKADADEVKVFWPKFLMNFAKPRTDTPGYLGLHTNAWYWEKGKLYDQTEGSEEIMYLHFMTWKHTLLSCHFGYLDDPTCFFISYSHIGLRKSDRRRRFFWIVWAWNGLWRRTLRALT